MGLQSVSYQHSMENMNCQVQMSIPSPQRNSKKYSKVNEELRKEFLSLIILNNKSIKEASQALNINYSSAKAILASHRKNLHSSKMVNKNGVRATYQEITPFSTFLGTFQVMSSIGGCHVSTFDQHEHQKLFYKTSIAPVILLQNEKEVESSEYTEQKQSV